MTKVELFNISYALYKGSRKKNMYIFIQFKSCKTKKRTYEFVVFSYIFEKKNNIFIIVI